MASLNGFLIGSETITTDTTSQEHTGFTFNGNCVIDSVCIQNYAKTNVQVLDTSVSILPEWTPDIKFLAKFDGTTDGSNVFGMSGSPTSWSLYRREYQGDILTKICDTEIDNMSWIDYKCKGNMEYEYLLFANTNSQISAPIITDKLRTSFYGYFLISSDADSMDAQINNNTVVYKLDLDITTDKVTVANDMTVLKNYSSYDTVVMGNRRFRSGTINSKLIPFDEDGLYDFDSKIRWATYLEDFGEFLHDKKYKYLKNRAGQIMKVVTEGASEAMSYKFVDEIAVGENGQQLIDATISYTEIGKV